MDNNQSQQMQTAGAPLSQAGGLAFSLSAVLFIVVGFILGIIMLISGIEEKSDPYIYLNYLAAPVAMTVASAITLRYKKIPFKSVFPVKCRPKYYLIALMLIFGLLFSVGYVDRPVIEFFKLLGYQERGADAYFPTLNGGWVVLALLVIAVMPALFEEFFFRGVILNTCEDSLGTVRTVFVVGFCFALFHASPEQTVYQFIAGCAFAFVAVRSGSILPSVLMHFINNALIVIFAACNLFDEGGNLVMPAPVSIAVTVLSALCFVGAVIWLIFDKKPVKKSQSGGVKYFFIYAVVGIFVLGLTWILSFFIH